jgi:hypothetical protein
MRRALTDLIDLAGFIAISAGCWHVWTPFGLIAAGISALLVGHDLEKRGGP